MSMAVISGCLVEKRVHSHINLANMIMILTGTVYIHLLCNAQRTISASLNSIIQSNNPRKIPSPGQSTLVSLRFPLHSISVLMIFLN